MKMEQARVEPDHYHRLGYLCAHNPCYRIPTKEPVSVLVVSNGNPMIRYRLLRDETVYAEEQFPACSAE